MPTAPVKAAADTAVPAFDAAMTLILKSEGGFAVRNTEAGGAVCKGISYNVFSDWRQKHGKPVPTLVDLRDITDDEAKAIYRKLFADPIRFDELPVGVGYVLLDSAVNNGVGGMLRILHAALGIGKSSRMDDIALAAIAQRGPASAINAFCDERKREQATFKNAPKPIKPGSKRTWLMAWDERVDAVRKRALAMIDGVKA